MPCKLEFQHIYKGVKSLRNWSVHFVQYQHLAHRVTKYRILRPGTGLHRRSKEGRKRDETNNCTPTAAQDWVDVAMPNAAMQPDRRQSTQYAIQTQAAYLNTCTLQLSTAL